MLWFSLQHLPLSSWNLRTFSEFWSWIQSCHQEDAFSQSLHTPEKKVSMAWLITGSIWEAHLTKNTTTKKHKRSSMTKTKSPYHANFHQNELKAVKDWIKHVVDYFLYYNHQPMARSLEEAQHLVKVNGAYKKKRQTQHNLIAKFHSKFNIKMSSTQQEHPTRQLDRWMNTHSDPKDGVSLAHW